MSGDWFVIMLITMVSANIIVCLVFFVRKFLWNIISMIHFNLILKSIVIYLLIPLFGGVFVFIDFFAYGRKVRVVSDDMKYLWITSNKSIRFWGNYEVLTFLQILFVVWMAGAMYFGVIHFIKVYRALKEVMKSAETFKDSIFQETKKEIFKRKANIKLLQCDFISTPFVVGVIKKRIFLPSFISNSEDRKLIYRHELLHCQKQDSLFRIIVHCLGAVFWFNPAIYLFINLFVEVNEMACDELVVLNKSKRERFVYANLLYRMSTNQIERENAVYFSEKHFKCLERRIENMNRKLRKAEWCYFTLLVFLMAVLCPATTWATSMGIVKVENIIIDKVIECNSVEEEEKSLHYDELFEREVDLRFPSKTLAAINPKGGTDIEECLVVDNLIITDGRYLEKGTKVHLYLIGNSDAKYKAGILDSNEKICYVKSVDGGIDYTFIIQESCEYRIYIENTGMVDVSVSGIVYINE